MLRGPRNRVVRTEGKLVFVVQGEVFDVAMDFRKNVPFFGQWVAERRSAQNKKLLWKPQGFAHGFITLSDRAEFLHKTTEYSAPQHVRCIRGDDSELVIKRSIDDNHQVSSNNYARPPIFAKAGYFS